jgi:hypothetical protein
MSHRPFNMWLLSGATLDKTQNKQLQEHLNTCKPCSKLACSLTQVEFELNTSPLVQPRAGFAGRFKASLPARMVARQRRQIWSLVISGLSVGTVLTVYQILPDLSGLSIGAILSSLINNSLSFIATLLHIRQISSYILMGIPPAIPLAVWISLTTVFFILSLIWILALGRILAPRGEKA